MAKIGCNNYLTHLDDMLYKDRIDQLETNSENETAEHNNM